VKIQNYLKFIKQNLRKNKKDFPENKDEKLLTNSGFDNFY